jgi:hypothetical protein
MRTEPPRLPFGAGFALLLSTIGAAGGFAYGAASREPAHRALEADLERTAAERTRFEAELRAARMDTDRAREALDQARRDLVAAQAQAGPPPDAGARDRAGPASPTLRRPSGGPRLPRPAGAPPVRP